MYDIKWISLGIVHYVIVHYGLVFLSRPNVAFVLFALLNLQVVTRDKEPLVDGRINRSSRFGRSLLMDVLVKKK